MVFEGWGVLFWRGESKEFIGCRAGFGGLKSQKPKSNGQYLQNF
jgi:hypothetical protein